MGSDKSSARGIVLRTGLNSESIRIKFMYRGMECRETLKLAHTKANIRYAERLRGEILNAIERGIFSYAKYFPESKQLKKLGVARTSDQITVGELIREQLIVSKRALSPNTAIAYQNSYDVHLKPKWDETLLRDLTPAALREWIGTLTCKARTIRQILIPLRGALEQAVNDDLIEGNPLDRVKLNKILDKESRKVEFIADPFSAEEIAAILATCEGQERNVWQFAFATGMRPSEYIALEWGSVDWIHGSVRVERARVVGITKSETKTSAGLRLIDMRQGAHDALMAQKRHTLLDDGTVFHDPLYDRGWHGYDRLGKRWTIILKRAGVRYRNPYQTRHTFASTLLSTGENPMYVAKQMGHTDTTMVIRTYGKWIEQAGGVLPDFYKRAGGRSAVAK